MDRLLLVMRHAKSDRDPSYASDHERPLAARGRRDAPRMARLMQRQGVTPQLILSSDALRARQTAELVHEALADAELRLDARLYGAGVEDAYTVLAELPAEVSCVLMIGHNPGLEMLVDELSGRDDALLKTCSVAVLQLSLGSWSEIGEDCARLQTIVHPREMDES